MSMAGDNFWDQYDPRNAKPADPEAAVAPVRLNGAHHPDAPSFEEAPPADDEDAYGRVSTKNNGAPLIEVLPPEFADDALALHLTSHYGDILRYVAAWDRWFIWNGRVWEHDDTLRVSDLCRKVCRSYSVNSPQNVQKTITSSKTISAVEKLCRADRQHARKVDVWDNDPWLLNTPGGVIDLRTGEQRDHDPDLHMTKITRVAPDPRADCPLWLKFLHEITNGDVLLQAYLQRACGYAMTGSTREQCMFFLYGTGRNGKGVLLNVFQWLMGDYAMNASPETFTSQGAGKHLTVLARLQGARLVVAQETEEGVPWAEARIKALTGGDVITANFMHQNSFEFRPQFKIFMAGNHKPGIKSVDEAMRARLNLLPFLVTFAKEDRDPHLTEKLQEEGPAILQWAINGCLDWQQVGLKPPPSVTEATDEYLQDEDVQGNWIAECCERGTPYREKVAILFLSWARWAKEAGEDPASKKRFCQQMIGRGFTSIKGTGNVAYLCGLRIPVPRPFSETETDR